jgi:hypothetical protein
MTDLCPRCHAPLPVSAVSTALELARCPACDEVIDLRAPTKSSVLAVPQPEGWVVEGSGAELTIRWRWAQLQTLFVVPFALLWNGILLVAAAANSQGFTHPEKLLFGLLVPHVWVGVGLAYVSVATVLNSTTVSARFGRVTVKAGPLPWRGNREFDAKDLTQLFVVERRGNRGAVSFDLCALTRDGRRQQVVNVPQPDQASFLERRFEQALGVVDRPVEGQYRSH